MQFHRERVTVLAVIAKQFSLAVSAFVRRWVWHLSKVLVNILRKYKSVTDRFPALFLFFLAAMCLSFASHFLSLPLPFGVRRHGDGGGCACRLALSLRGVYNYAFP